MRIAFDVAQTCRQGAGCAWHADALAHALAAAAGPERQLILYHDFGRWVNHDKRRHNPLHGTRIDGCPSPFKELDQGQSTELWQALADGKATPPGEPDLIHSNSYMAPRVPGIPLVYTVHDLFFWTRPEFSTEPNRIICQEQFLAALSHAAAFHFISQATLDDFEALFPNWLERSRRPYRVIRSGPRLQAKSPPQPEQRSCDPLAPWLFVGTLEPRKNVEALLDAYLAYARLSPSPRPLQLVGGSGWKSEATQARIAALSQTLPISYRGYLPDEDLAASYQSAFAVLSPSHCEGFGLPVIEAMAFGLPVVCNPYASAQEFAAEAATFVDFGQAEAVAQAMLELETKQSLYLERSQLSATKAQRFSWDKTARQLLALYESLLPAPALPAQS